MASLKELVDLFNNGALGKMLAERFHGERGHVYPRQDSEFVIGFASEEATPSGEAIGIAVTEFYQGLGYVVKVLRYNDPDVFVANVYCPKENFGVILVNITTKYPISLGGPHDHLRVMTNATI